jgi:murein DD-endopeptidase MepM/ murein hydrolase activator NlpD
MAANVSAKDRPLLPAPPVGDDAAVFPVQGATGFGESAARFGAWRGGRRHEGQDVFAPAGSPLFALRDGKVAETGDDGGRGNYVAVFNPDLDQTYLYLHMKNPARQRPGEWVRAGERVGAVGCTGSCWGDHLHVELRRGRGAQGRPLDPLPLLRRLQAR